MQRKDYQKPAVCAIALSRQPALLSSSSGVTATKEGYGEANSQNWAESE
jgi:hypothetical protein